MGLPNYPYHRPFGACELGSRFWADARGPGVSLGLLLPLGLASGPARLLFRPYQLPLCTDYVGKGCNYSCDDCCLHVSVRINPDRRHKWSVNDDPLGFAPVFILSCFPLFLDDLFSFEFLWYLTFLFIRCSCTPFFSWISICLFGVGSFSDASFFFSHLIPGPVASPSLHFFFLFFSLIGTTRF